MGLAYGIALRERVVTAIEGGLTHRQAGERFCVAVSTAGNWARLSRKGGCLAPARQGKPSRSKLDAFEGEILTMIEECKDIALHEIAGRLAQIHGLQVVPSTVHKFLAKRGLTFKKRQAMPVNSNDRMCSHAG